MSKAHKFEIDNFYKKKVLGVLFRGTDMKTQERHPYPATLKQIVSYIDSELKNNKYDLIFPILVIRYLYKLKSRYKEKICYYNSFRSNKI